MKQRPHVLEAFCKPSIVLGRDFGLLPIGFALLTGFFLLVSHASASGSDNAVAYQINPGHSGVSANSSLTPPFAQRWQVTLPNTVSYPLIAQGMVYVVANDANSIPALYALDQASGKILWSQELPHSPYSSSAVAPAYDSGRIFVVTDSGGAAGIIVAYDAGIGAFLWSSGLPGQFFFDSPPTAANGIAYVAGEESGGTLYAVDETLGTLLATRGVENGSSSPTLSDNAVFTSYVCNWDDAFSLNTLASLWSYRGACSGGGGSTPVYSGGRIFTRDWAGTGSLILDASTGAVLGNYGSPTALPATPAVKGNTMWVLSGSTLTALDISSPSSPSTLWNFAGDGQLNTAPIVLSTPSGDFVLVGSSSGMLYTLNANSGGAPVWSANVGTAIQTSEMFTGLSIGQDLLVVSAGNTLSAFSNPPPTGFFPVVPARVLDTRPGYQTIDGLFSGMGSIPGGGTTYLQVLGRGGVPSQGVVAVVLNVTATQPSGPGFVTVWPSDGARPNTSNLNFVAGQTIPNLVITAISAGGQISLFNSPTSASTDLVVDVTGYFTSATALTTIAPVRLLDTRVGPDTIDGQFTGTGPIPGNNELDLTIAGRGNLPVSGIESIVMNVTAVSPTSAGFIRVWPTGSTAPATSNLNFVAGETIPNLVISRVSNGGQVSLYNSAGETDVVVDAEAWFPAGADLISVGPSRILDTRPNMTTIDGQFASIGTIGAQSTLNLTVAGRAGVPSAGVGAVVMNITAADATAKAYITVWPTGSELPIASNLNLTPGQTIANLVIAKVGSNGQVSLFNSAGSTHLIADIIGWFPVAH